MNLDTWLWLDTGENDAATNMAIDEALLLHAEARGLPLWRVYGWKRPSISIGYFQPYPAEFAPTHDIVRRLTGGGMVFHGKDLTFTFIAPRSHEFCARRTNDCYRELHASIAQALNRAGMTCTLQESKGSNEQGACFELPVAHDIMAGGRKITGGAQKRTSAGLLHQGSLLLPPSLRRPIEELKPALRNGMTVRWTDTTLTQTERAAAAELATAKYGRADWNQRVTGSRRSVPRPPAR